MSKRKLRQRVKLLEAVAVELVERIEALEGDGSPRWRDCYVTDLDPSAPISDELTYAAPGGYLWDDDDWRRGSYL